MKQSSLKRKTIHALSWSFLESLGLQGGRFVTGIVLARLLFPAQFGLIGMLWVFMAVAQTFLDSGFCAALIQKDEATPTDICSVFYFNIAVGVAAASLLCLVAPWIAAFYNQPILTPLTRALSVTLVINSFGVVQGVILMKQIDFKTLAKVNVISNLVAGIIAIILAAAGFGVWSLVFQQISSAVFGTLLMWLLHPWRPALVFSFRSLREMFGFGSRLLASGLLGQIFDNIYLLVIGKLFSPADLGFFTRAKSSQELPSNTLSNMIARVTFPVFSAIQKDPAALQKGMKKALTTLVLLNFPMMVGLAIIARPLVLVLLTDKWAECIPYLRLFCFWGLLFPVQVINLNVLLALGHSKLYLRLEIIKKVLIVISIAITWRWGISAIIYGLIVLSFICYYLNSYYTGVFIGYPIGEQLRDLCSYLLMAALMGAAVYLIGLVPFPSLWSMLLIQIFTGVVIYLLLCRVCRLGAFMEIWQAGWDRMPFLRAGTGG